jgi:hypothetical protein
MVTERWSMHIHRWVLHNVRDQPCKKTRGIEEDGGCSGNVVGVSRLFHGLFGNLRHFASVTWEQHRRPASLPAKRPHR